MFSRSDYMAGEKCPDWLKDFATTLDTKSALQSGHDKKWNSIEEKLADIKERVGFSLLGVHRDDEGDVKTASINKSASDKECNCENKHECSCNKKGKHNPAHIDKMKQILDFVHKVIEHEPHLDGAIIVSKCKEQDGLNFNDLPIDTLKLIKYIDGKLPKKEEKVEYRPADPNNESNLSDNLAEYYRHALGNK